jgi:hypothetical protein
VTSRVVTPTADAAPDEALERRRRLEEALTVALDLLGALGVGYVPGDELLEDRLPPR